MLQCLKLIDVRDDTLKYLLILQLLLETASQVKVHDAYPVATVNEAGTFLMNLSKDYMKGDFCDLTHDIIHYFAQVFVELGYGPSHGIRILKVCLVFLPVGSRKNCDNPFSSTQADCSVRTRLK